jgi:hypothetical protein
MDESFLQNVHVRYVWVADEIVWGMRFVDVLHEFPDGTFAIDYSRFDDVVPLAQLAGDGTPLRVDGTAAQTPGIIDGRAEKGV